MELLFSQEEVWEMFTREIIRNAKEEKWQEEWQKGWQEGTENRDMLYGELLRRLEPLGRIGDLIAATEDKAKLRLLAQEFGLKML